MKDLREFLANIVWLRQRTDLIFQAYSENQGILYFWISTLNFEIFTNSEQRAIRNLNSFNFLLRKVHLKGRLDYGIGIKFKTDP